MVLTSLEFDHADIYDSVEQIEAEFEAVLPKLSKVIIGNDEYPSILKLKNKYPELNWEIYGQNSVAGPKNIKTTSVGSEFDLVIQNKCVSFKTDIVGLHNVLNIASCVLVLNSYGFEVGELQKAVLHLSLVKRRQEVRGTYKGAIVIDDFAHHPRAIKLTIDAIKTKYNNKKIITVFEPVSATARSSIFQNEFKESLLASNAVIIAQSPIQTTVHDQKNLNCEQLVKEVKEDGINAYCVKELSDLREKIDLEVNDESVLLILSNRTCIGLWESDFVKEL